MRGFRKFGIKTRGKFHNVKTTVDGIKFDSKREAVRYLELKALERAGIISFLRLQVSFPLHALGGGLVCRYRADFTYVLNGKLVVEDVKGMLTPMYILKRKWLLLEHGITIVET